MNKYVGYMLAGLLVIAAGAGIAWLILRGKKNDAARAAVDLTNAWHQQDVAAKRAEIGALKEDFDANADKIKALEGQLAAKRAKLDAKFTSAGLSADEVAQRLSVLDL